MAVYFNGTNIPENGDNFWYNGVNLDKVYYNNVLVWEKIKETSFTMMNNWMEDVACTTGGNVHHDGSAYNKFGVMWFSDSTSATGPTYAALFNNIDAGTAYAVWNQDARNVTVNLGSSFAGWTLTMTVDVDPVYNELYIHGLHIGTVSSSPKTIFSGTVDASGSITIRTTDSIWRWGSGINETTPPQRWYYDIPDDPNDPEEWKKMLYSDDDYYTITKTTNLEAYGSPYDGTVEQYQEADRDIKLKVTVTLTNGTTTLTDSVSGTEQAEFNGHTFTLKQ